MELISFFVVGTDREKKSVTKKSIEDYVDEPKKIFEMPSYTQLVQCFESGMDGTYISILNEGDVVEPNRYQIQAEYLESHPSLDGVGGGTIIVDENYNILELPRFVETDPDMLKGMCFFDTPMDLGCLLLRSDSLKKLKFKKMQSEQEVCRFLMFNLAMSAVEIPVLKKYKETVTSDEQQELTLRMFESYNLGYMQKGMEYLFENPNKEDAEVVLRQSGLFLKKFLENIKSKLDFDIGKLEFVCRNIYLNRARSLGVQERNAIRQVGGFGKEVLENAPLVSVVIPTFNRAESLKSSVDSVLNQTYSNVEVIIVDDCSEDNTEETAHELEQSDARVHYIKNNQNGGPGKCRNIGVECARGYYVAFHDDDDQWHDDKLMLQMFMLLSDTSIDMAFGKMTRYQNGVFCNRVLEEFDWYNIKANFFQEQLKNNYIGAPTVVIKKESFQLIKGFDEKLRCLEDWEFAIRAAQSLKVELIPTSLMDVNITEQSVSFNKERYIEAWGTILSRYADVATQKGVFLKLMKKHLRNELYNSNNLTKDLECARNCLLNKGVGNWFMELIIDEDEIINYKIQKDAQERCVELRAEIDRTFAYKDEVLEELQKAMGQIEFQQDELAKAFAYMEEARSEIALQMKKVANLQTEIERLKQR